MESTHQSLTTLIDNVIVNSVEAQGKMRKCIENDNCTEILIDDYILKAFGTYAWDSFNYGTDLAASSLKVFSNALSSLGGSTIIGEAEYNYQREIGRASCRERV